MGIDIDKKDYQSTIIKSLPNLLANFMSSQLTTARLFTTTRTMEPDVLMSIIAKEAWPTVRRQNIQCAEMQRIMIMMRQWLFHMEDCLKDEPGADTMETKGETH